jgi:hypothetical protein
VIETAARGIKCYDTTWRAGVTLRVRYAAVDLERATFTAPSFVTGSDHPFSAYAARDEQQVRDHVQGERGESEDRWMPILASLRGSDAANLATTDVDLSPCRFASTLLLDQLRLEGRCIFDHPPPGVHTGQAWPPVWRWSSRQSMPRNARGGPPPANTQAGIPADPPKLLSPAPSGCPH